MIQYPPWTFLRETGRDEYITPGDHYDMARYGRVVIVSVLHRPLR